MRAALLLITMLLAGCRSDLPTYPPMEAHDAWRIVRERTSWVRGFSAGADTTLTGKDGTSVRLDAALVLAPPDRMRLRAWKLGHAVLDVTSDGGVVWVDAPKGPGGRGGMDELGVAPADLVRGLLLVPGWTIEAQEPVRAVRRADRYVYELASPAGGLICEVDVRTLVVRTWRISGGEQSLELSEHQLAGSVPWPRLVTLRDGPRSARLRCTDVLLDEVPDDRVFAAPESARRLP